MTRRARAPKLEYSEPPEVALTELANPSLSAWESFYVIVGSSGAALIGIQFVVVTLVASVRKRALAEPIGAFATPTVVHFGAALLVSAVMSAPWPSLAPVSVAIATCGLAGLGYGVVVVRRTQRQTDYKPVREDWFWYSIAPSGGYAALAVAPLFLTTRTHAALFLIGAAALALLLIGVHNAWDTVTHVIITDDAAAASPISEVAVESVDTKETT
jgi:hypothetical protein